MIGSFWPPLCKRCLFKHGIRVRAIGIDISGKVAAKAKKNLDEFIPGNVVDVRTHEGDADIVICMNMERFVSLNLKGRIVGKCAEFLKEDGVLITGVSKTYRNKLKLKEPSSAIPAMVCPTGGLMRALNYLNRFAMPKDTRMMEREKALRYSIMLLSDSKNTGRFRRLLAAIQNT